METFSSPVIAPDGRIAVIVDAADSAGIRRQFLLTGTQAGLTRSAFTDEMITAGAHSGKLLSLRKVLPCSTDQWAVQCDLLPTGAADPVQALLLLKHAENLWSAVWMQGDQISGGVDEVFRGSLIEWRSHPASRTIVVLESIIGDLVGAGNDQVVESWQDGTWHFHAREGVSIGPHGTRPTEFSRVRHIRDGAVFEAKTGSQNAVAGGYSPQDNGEALALAVPGMEPPGFAGLECVNTRLLAADISGASRRSVFEVTLGKHGLSGSDPHQSRWLFMGEAVPHGNVAGLFREGQSLAAAGRTDWWIRSFDAAILRGNRGVVQVTSDIARQALAVKPRMILRWDDNGQWHSSFIGPGLAVPGTQPGTEIHEVALITAGPPTGDAPGLVLASTLIAPRAWTPGTAAPGDAMTAWVADDGSELHLVARVGSELADDYTISHLRGPEGDPPVSEDCLSGGGLLILEVTLGKAGQDKSAIITAAIPA